MDGDGREDLLALLGSGRVDVFWNRAAGLARGPSTELAVDPRDSAYGRTAELDGDGRADLFVRAKRGEPSSWRFESWLGDGSGGFAIAASVPFDADAELDLILVRVDGSAFADVLSLSHASSDASKLQVRRWRGRGDGRSRRPRSSCRSTIRISAWAAPSSAPRTRSSRATSTPTEGRISSSPRAPSIRPAFPTCRASGSETAPVAIHEAITRSPGGRPSSSTWTVTGATRSSSANSRRRETPGYCGERWTERGARPPASAPRTASSSRSSTGIPRGWRPSSPTASSAPTGSPNPVPCGSRRFRRCRRRRSWTSMAMAIATSSASRPARSVPPAASSSPGASAIRDRVRRCFSSRSSSP
ncbi:MAG: VCBS repeat-containing protein [Holophagales bacterium]|nr:VCBS repeat-containing protein [Holophagales bacterium]